MDSRRVSLPVSLAVSRHYTPLAAPVMLLSPHFYSPSSACHRRSLPSTPLPNGGRRSLPPTPPTPMSELEELIITDSPVTTDDSLSPQAPRDRIRSFDLRDGHLLDRGFQKTPRSQEGSNNELVVKQNKDVRRATCPDIFLFDSQNSLMRHVVLRIYGSKNCGKKSLANRIHHFATSMGPEEVDPDENGSRDYTKTTTFLLNGKEVTLEIVLESALENSPFRQSKTMYIAMYNVDSRASFAYATQILERITLANKNKPTQINAFLIANKIDLKRNQVISSSEGRSVAKLFNSEFLEVSALLGLNTEDTWTAILQQLQEPLERRRPSWVERLLNRGKGVAKSAEEAIHKIIT